MRALALVALLFSTCKIGPFHDPPTAPDPIPDPSSPDWPTPEAAPPASACDAAYDRMQQLFCPPAEDAHRGWADFDCPELPASVPACVLGASTANCLAARRCLGEAK